MRRLRQFVRTQSKGGLLAVYIAYSLAIQAMMASVGLGMSAGAAPDQLGFVLCSYASHRDCAGTGRPAKRRTRPQCPFCFVAAQSAGHVATDGRSPGVSGLFGLADCRLSRSRSAKGPFVPQFRHRLGEPRAPPAVSV